MVCWWILKRCEKWLNRRKGGVISQKSISSRFKKSVYGNSNFEIKKQTNLS